jgi:hypothetical protein
VTTGAQRAPHRLPQRPRLTARGYAGRGLGRASYVEAPREYRGTTVQVCGLFPWTVGSGAPTVGTPLGPGHRRVRHLRPALLVPPRQPDQQPERCSSASPRSGRAPTPTGW